MTDKIFTRREGAVAHIVFNNPDKLNAISLEMWQGMGDAVVSFEADPEVRVIVLSGAGDKAFVAGADVSKYEEERMGEDSAEHYARTGERGLSALYGSNKATIAAIDGFCIGGGISVVTCCDLRIATPKSSFAQPAMRYGIGYRYKSLRRAMQCGARLLVGNQHVGQPVAQGLEAGNGHAKLLPLQQVLAGGRDGAVHHAHRLRAVGQAGVLLCQLQRRCGAAPLADTVRWPR